MSEDRHLVIANAYPNDANLYNYGFLHRRVKKYLDAGLAIDIFRIDTNEPVLRQYVFDGVTVTTGNKTLYAEFVSTSSHATFLVHFPLDYIIAPIAAHRPTTPVIAWLHGYETLSWHRRWYDTVEDAQFINRVKSLRMHVEKNKVPFLANLFQAEDLDIRFVAVSNWFLKHSVEPDAGVRVTNISIIPNVIDTKIFPFVRKNPELRYKVLVIKPFTSYKYANDLVVKTILSLRELPYFDKLHFSIIGDGPIFDKTLEPLRSLANVHITKAFLRQEEIAALHADHGIFLSPTRWDSQGVSIGEAMSSGLVPVSTAISAIPEFVTDGRSGLLANTEDPDELASYLKVLFESPETFTLMSEQASIQIQTSCGPQATTDREIELIKNRSLGRNRDIHDVDWKVAYSDLEEEVFSVLRYFSERHDALSQTIRQI
ncbi:glycosyltransferase family 4 protein [Pseudarthrobacter sp. So.54]